MARINEIEKVAYMRYMPAERTVEIVYKQRLTLTVDINNVAILSKEWKLISRIMMTFKRIVTDGVIIYER